MSNNVHIVLNYDHHAHFFNVSLHVKRARPRQRFSLPCWTPGSYMIREFAQHIVSIEALENDELVPINKISKNAFEVLNQGGNITLKYKVYAFDSSIRAAFIDDLQAFFNGTALFLCPQGLEDASYTLMVPRPVGAKFSSWQVATGMQPQDLDNDGFGQYIAQSYEELIDFPFQISPMKRLNFMVNDIPHEIALVGDVRSFDEQRLVQDLSMLCKEHISFFKEAPFNKYLFIARFEEVGAGGLEHRNSSMLLASPNGLPKCGQREPDSNYRGFLGLCSHEYFHAWNIKRLKPLEFVNLNLDHECYTSLLWLFEGITSYYDDLLLLKAGLISIESYLELMSKNYSRYLKTPGRQMQSVAEASFDAWIKFYRPHENSLNTTISYYLKGSLIAMMLDMSIRLNTQSKYSLDDVMQRAYELYGHGRGVNEDEFLLLLSEIGHIDIDEFKAKYLYGVLELPLNNLWSEFGIDCEITNDETPLDDRTKMSCSLGMKIRFDDQRAFISFVEKDGAAMEAGLSPQDELIAVDNIRLDQNSLSELMGSLIASKAVSLLISRKKQIKTYEVIPKSLAKNVCKLSLKKNVSGASLNLRKALLKG